MKEDFGNLDSAQDFEVQNQIFLNMALNNQHSEKGIQNHDFKITNPKSGFVNQDFQNGASIIRSWKSGFSISAYSKENFLIKILT